MWFLPYSVAVFEKLPDLNPLSPRFCCWNVMVVGFWFRLVKFCAARVLMSVLGEDSAWRQSAG